MSVVAMMGRRGGGSIVPAFTPNLPAGMTLQSDITFDTPTTTNTVVDGWQFSDGGIVNAVQNGVNIPAYQRIEDSSGGFGPYIARVNYSENSPSGNQLPYAGAATGAVSISQLSMPRYQVREWYWTLRFRLSPNYIGHNGGWVEKFWYPTTDPAVSSFGVVQISGGVTGEVIQMANWDFIGETGFARANALSGTISRGDWHTMEVHQRLNTYVPGGPQPPDGFSRVWIDGELRSDLQNVYIGTYAPQPSGATEQLYWNLARLATTRGGGEATVLTPVGGMYRDYDRMALHYKVEA